MPQAILLDSPAHWNGLSLFTIESKSIEPGTGIRLFGERHLAADLSIWRAHLGLDVPSSTKLNLGALRHFEHVFVQVLSKFGLASVLEKELEISEVRNAEASAIGIQEHSPEGVSVQSIVDLAVGVYPGDVRR